MHLTLLQETLSYALNIFAILPSKFHVQLIRIASLLVNNHCVSVPY